LTLAPRGRTDYVGQRVNRVSKGQQQSEKRRSEAIAVAYSETATSAAAALRAGRSVLVRAPGLLVGDLREAVAGVLNEQSSQAFVVVPYDTEADRAYSSYGDHEGPLHRRLTRFYKLLKSPESGKFFVLDFLDPLFAGNHSEQGDLIHEMIRKKDLTWLAFASEGTALPPSLREMFRVQLKLQPLRRAGMWQLMAYDEVREVLGAETLTVAHQVALYHACAGLNAHQFRQCVDMTHPSGVPASPFEAIDELKRGLGFAPYSGPAVDSLPVAEQQLHQRIVLPFQQYQKAATDEDVARFDSSLPRGVLLEGDNTVMGADLAAFLARELSAQLIVTHGATLDSGENPFGKVYPLPAVVFVEDLDAGLLGDGGSLRAFLAAWRTIPTDQPVLVIATWCSGVAPLALRRRFTVV
jgi:hypothetical protein